MRNRYHLDFFFFFFSFKLKEFLLKLFPKQLLEFTLPAYLAGNKRLMFISRNRAHRKPSFSASDFRTSRLCERRGWERSWMSGGTWAPICHLPEVTRQLSVLSTPSLATAAQAFSLAQVSRSELPDRVNQSAIAETAQTTASKHFSTLEQPRCVTRTLQSQLESSKALALHD